MKQVDCDIIKDLLPSYIDKTASNSTNELVEEHLQNCEDCTSILENMNSVVDESKRINIQEEQIDYLKGFKKDKKISIIKSILIVIIAILGIFVALDYISWLGKFYVNVNNLSIECRTKESSSTLSFEIKDKVFDLEFEYEYLEDNNIYVKVIGKCNLGSPTSNIAHVKLNENTKKVYLKDKKGKLIEIWNKDKGVLTKMTKFKM